MHARCYWLHLVAVVVITKNGCALRLLILLLAAAAAAAKEGAALAVPVPLLGLGRRGLEGLQRVGQDLAGAQALPLVVEAGGRAHARVERCI